MLRDTLCLQPSPDRRRPTNSVSAILAGGLNVYKSTNINSQFSDVSCSSVAFAISQSDADFYELYSTHQLPRQRHSAALETCSQEIRGLALRESGQL